MSSVSRKFYRICRDFKEEQSAIQKLVEDRGHILLMGVKGHPEMAGVGVEYTWGYSKMVYRRTNTLDPKTLRERAEWTLSPEVMPLDRVRRFARRARSFKRAYKLLGTRPGEVEVAKFVKRAKTHRSALDGDFGFLAREGGGASAEPAPPPPPMGEQ